jgi:nucleotide-binding universal stress UspA family protein
MTLKTLLIPLDGSRLAEAVLPLASYLAKLSHARVVLFHVIELDAPGQVHGEHHLTGDEEASAYLTKIAQGFPTDITLEQHVHSTAQKDVAASIVDHSKEMNVDLIVMCAHGQSGLQTRIFGNIAQQVLSRGDVPILLISPEKEGQATGKNCQCILVPLDGDPDHEAGLDMAVQLAEICQAKLHLVMVVHQLATLPGEQAASAVLLPGATSALLELACEDAELYLVDQIGKLLDKNIQVTGEVQRGDPARQIAQSAQKVGADMIVLGTHGKTAMDAFWSGSVTPKLITQTHLPLLLVPVHES